MSALVPEPELIPATKLITKEVPVINKVGGIVGQTCQHQDRFIPGLDADFCPICRTYWVDEQMREKLLNKRKSSPDLEL